MKLSKYCPMSMNTDLKICKGKECQWWIERRKETGQRDKNTNNIITEDVGDCSVVLLTQEILRRLQGENL